MRSIVLALCAIIGMSAQCPIADIGGYATSMAFGSDGTLFVTEQAGTIWRIRDGTREPYAHVDANDFGERGLLGLAVDGDSLIVYYIYGVEGTSVQGIPNARARLSRINPDKTESVLLEIGKAANGHVGGAVHIYDEHLYVGVGEGVSVDGTAPDYLRKRGRILRLNLDGSIPQDNPFVAETTGALQATYAYGLRNPFTLAFGEKVYINDVGGEKVEEINELVRGGYYGWPECEGPCDTGEQPVYSYDHRDGAAITGGVFFDGAYYFADFIGTNKRGWIKRLAPDGGVTTVLADPDAPLDLDVHDGRLYYLSFNGRVYAVD